MHDGTVSSDIGFDVFCWDLVGVGVVWSDWPLVVGCRVLPPLLLRFSSSTSS